MVVLGRAHVSATRLCKLSRTVCDLSLSQFEEILKVAIASLFLGTLDFWTPKLAKNRTGLERIRNLTRWDDHRAAVENTDVSAPHLLDVLPLHVLARSTLGAFDFLTHSIVPWSSRHRLGYYKVSERASVSTVECKRHARAPQTLSFVMARNIW